MFKWQAGSGAALLAGLVAIGGAIIAFEGSQSTTTGGAANAYQEKYVDANGIKTRYLEAGQGDALVLVHGNDFGSGVSANLWDRNIAGLAKTFHVYAFDKLGAGFTDNPKRDADWTSEGVVQHGYDFVRAVGLKRFHMLGQSRGAYFVARFALEHPDLVQTLIMVDSNTLGPDVPRTQTRDELLGGAGEDVREAQRYRWTQLSHTTDHITDEALDLSTRIQGLPKTQQAREALKRLGDPFNRSISAQKPDTLARLRKGELKVPMLLIWGYNDRSAILAAGQKLFDILAEGNPKARMYIINRAGHFNFREYPDEFNAIVTHFIKSRQSGS